jgi:hypothetical protein
VIILSSASSSEDLPVKYDFYAKHNLHKILPAWVFKYSTFILQPLYEAERKAEKVTCNAKLQAKDALFMKRASAMLLKWSRRETDNIGKILFKFMARQIIPFLREILQQITILPVAHTR